MAKIIYANGQEKVVTPDNNGKFSLDYLHEIVGGFIEGCQTCDGGYLIINEEGKLLDLQYNAKATALYKYGAHDSIVGDVLYVGKDELDTLN